MDIKKKYEDYEKSKRVFLKADKETAARIRCNVGDEYSIFPEPKTKEEAFERLENYNGLIGLEMLVESFKKTNSINKRTLNDRLKLIDDFINEAETININEATQKVATNHPKAKHYEYLKLKYDYYKNDNLEYHGFNYFFASITTLVYSEYFLFKDWIINQISNLTNSEKSNPDITKEVFIQKITEAEKLAKETLEISFNQDLFEIEQKKVNKKHHTELISSYYSNSINKYNNIVNLYKASNDQFHFLNSEANNVLTEEDRIDFIATVLFGYLTDASDENNDYEFDELNEIFSQLKNIDTLIYETRLLELKVNIIKKTIVELENKLEEKRSNTNTSSKKEQPKKQAILKRIINEEFLKHLQHNYSTIQFCFDDEVHKIVPDEFSHDKLMVNFPIDENIIKFYYSPIQDFISNDEFDLVLKTGYVGNKKTFLKPYSVIIYGAYYARKDLYYKLSFASTDSSIKLNNKSIKYFEDLIPYFKEYANGFKQGYDEFENVCINPFLPKFADKTDYTNKVFEYITKTIIFEHSWLNNHSGFTTSHNINSKIKKIINGFEDGQKQGFFYRAWVIVFSNNNLFAPLFKNLYTKDNSSSKLETENKANKTSNAIIELQKIIKASNENPYTKNALVEIGNLINPEATIESVSFSKQGLTLNKEAKPAKKLSEKWHALLYLLELKASNSKPPINHEGSFIKSAIEEIGKKRTGTTGQSFYRQTLIINDLINNSSLLVGTFGNNWKETIITLSNNDQIIIDYIENNY